MAITFLQEKKKQKYLIYVLIMVFFAIFLTIWFGYFRKPPIIPEEIAPTETAKSWQKIEINFKILEDPLFQDLKAFEKIPAFEGEVGRENPFIPF